MNVKFRLSVKLTLDWNEVRYSFTAIIAETITCCANFDISATRRLSAPYHFFFASRSNANIAYIACYPALSIGHFHIGVVLC